MNANGDSVVKIGERVKARRAALGLKQAELAEKAGVSPSYLSRLEAGQSGDSVDELLRIARALACRLADLVGETEDEMVAEVRRRLPDGTELAITFERLARGLPNQSESDQEFIRQSIEAFAARYGQESEANDAT